MNGCDWGNGAGDGDRTRTTSLEGWGSTIELHPRAVCPMFYKEIITSASQKNIDLRYFLKIL